MSVKLKSLTDKKGVVRTMVWGEARKWQIFANENCYISNAKASHQEREYQPLNTTFTKRFGQKTSRANTS